ncbi:MAG: hypothetical protein NTZ82_03115 [Bacteroidetes bacterium]|nr:hypothetical protein [Bacteroidota bacterium]
MRKLIPLAIFILFCISPSLFAQSNIKVISSVEMGNLQCKYLKLESAHSLSNYTIHIIFLSQKFIYKPEQDTIQLKTNDQVSKLINELKAGILVIDDEEMDINIQNETYSIYKNKGYTENKFLVIANRDKKVITPVNKYFIQQLIDWLKGVDFGKG